MHVCFMHGSEFWLLVFCMYMLSELSLIVVETSRACLRARSRQSEAIPVRFQNWHSLGENRTTKRISYRKTSVHEK